MKEKKTPEKYMYVGSAGGAHNGLRLHCGRIEKRMEPGKSIRARKAMKCGRVCVYACERTSTDSKNVNLVNRE